MEIYKKFSFDSAHYLPNLPEDHKCRRMHGHTFNIKVHITGAVDPEIGWIMDFAEIKTIVQSNPDNVGDTVPGLCPARLQHQVEFPVFPMIPIRY